jgi:hypothetical protein
MFLRIGLRCRQSNEIESERLRVRVREKKRLRDKSKENPAKRINDIITF